MVVEVEVAKTMPVVMMFVFSPVVVVVVVVIVIVVGSMTLSLIFSSSFRCNVFVSVS